MNDIDKTNADECLDELFKEKDNKCNCNDNCECGDDCHCTPENKCSEDCTCGEECSCSTDEECNCGETCECTSEDKCDKNCATDENLSESDCHYNSDCGCKTGGECTCGEECDCGDDCTCHDTNEKCKCGCGETLEEDEKEKQPSDGAFEALLRLQAEFDNYRKRTEKEKGEIYHHGFVDAVADFLPALDSFKMAKEYITDKNTLIGIEYIEKGILSTLEKMGVTAIDATGKFDPNLHTAIDTSSDENFEVGDIVKECYKGFKMGDKVIRFSQVIVRR